MILMKRLKIGIIASLTTFSLVTAKRLFDAHQFQHFEIDIPDLRYDDECLRFGYKRNHVIHYKNQHFMVKVCDSWCVDRVNIVVYVDNHTTGPHIFSKELYHRTIEEKDFIKEVFNINN